MRERDSVWESEVEGEGKREERKREREYVFDGTVE